MTETDKIPRHNASGKRSGGRAGSGNAEDAVPAGDGVCDAGPGEYDDAGFQNEKHTIFVCFLYVIREVSCRINAQCGLLSCQIR